jgi:CheY-like chemotaxis protein
LIHIKIITVLFKTLTNISHALKEPLTSIKGFSQLLLENYREELEEDVLETIQNIFEQSILLENKIVNILDNIQTESSQYDILLIEDDLATIRLLTSYFDSKDITCKGVVSGTKGLEELVNNPPKLVLLDIILPDYSGYEICKKIKVNQRLKNIPVFLLTAIPGSEVEKHIKEVKADGYILKPFDFSDFESLFKYLE